MQNVLLFNIFCGETFLTCTGLLGDEDLKLLSWYFRMDNIKYCTAQPSLNPSLGVIDFQAQQGVVLSSYLICQLLALFSAGVI